MESPIRILVVDDDEEDFILLQALVAEQSDFPRGSFLLEHAKDIGAARARLSEGNWDLLIVDYFLGSDTGMDFLVSAYSAGVSVPALLVTGQTDIPVAGAMTSLMESGKLRFLHKNDLTWPSMVKSIRNLIDRRIGPPKN